MKTTLKIPENWKPITGASQFAMTPENYVYNLKTGKTLKRYWHNLFYHSYITDDEGDCRRVNHKTLTVARHELPDEEMAVLWDYPDYKVTPYGAVWKYRNTGKRHRKNPFLVGTKDIGKKEYVRLRTEDGRHHWVRMEKIMADAYPND